MRYTASDLPTLMDKIHKNSIGYDGMFDRLFALHETKQNYPPFKKAEVYVDTQDGKLFVEGQKEDKESGTDYQHRGMAQRSFTRAWTLSDETEVRSVTFEDGLLTIDLGKVVPEHHQRKDFL